MGTRGKALLRFFLGVVLFSVASWLLLVGIAANRAAEKTTTVTVRATTTSPSSEMLKHWKWNGRERSGFFHFDKNHLIYVSKRRVPNGPDPIHNRYIFSTFLLMLNVR